MFNKNPKKMKISKVVATSVLFLLMFGFSAVHGFANSDLNKIAFIVFRSYR
jgi:hypothetical protein